MNLRSITARQLMNEEVVALREDAPVKEAILTLEEYRITGAPVMNALGECVGVFSASDVLRRRQEMEDGETARVGVYFQSDPFVEDPEEFTPAEDYDEEVLGQDTVGQWMTTRVQTVGPEATVEEVCRRMVSEKIHRLLVMEGAKLLGIITSFDVVRLVAGIPETEARRTAKKSKKRARTR